MRDPATGLLRTVTVAAVILVSGCLAPETRSHEFNPLGWPARGLQWAGNRGAATDLPLVRDTGRLLFAVGDLADAPALWVEGLATFSPEDLYGGTEKLLLGSGGTVTAALNLPFFWARGRQVDLARDADLVNDALAYLEEQPIERWRYHEGDRREHVFPPGTRVHAAGSNLVWELPGGIEIVQGAEVSPLFAVVVGLTGDAFIAQERSWGFVVASRDVWDARTPRQRGVTILHEFYHQEQQIRRVFRGWGPVYWPAYGAAFPFTGWWHHWAEVESGIAAYVVDTGLQRWRPDHRPDRRGHDRGQ